MNITLNSLPTRTWNWLRMNDSTVKIEGDFISYTPDAVYQENDVLWEPASSWCRSSSIYGFNKDFTEITKDSDTSLVRVSEGHVMNSPIVIKYTYKDNGQTASRLVLEALKDSTLTAVLLIQSENKEGNDISALQVEVRAEENATVNIYAAQITGTESICLNELGGYARENAKVNLTRLELGGKKAFTGASIDLVGNESMFSALAGYHARENQLLDMNYVALHHGKRTESFMEVNGTLEENSKKIFRGTIDFQQGCQGAKGTENENVLLFGEKMVNQTIPLILCKEEDVEGNHGASIGQLDDKLLFYLASRGIAPENAQKMIAQARIRSICEKFPSEDVRKAIEKYEHMEVCVDEE